MIKPLRLKKQHTPSFINALWSRDKKSRDKKPRAKEKNEAAVLFSRHSGTVRITLPENKTRACTKVASHLITLCALSLSAPVIQAETLDQAWQYALANNKQLFAAEQGQLAAHEQLKMAKSTRLPALILSANYVRVGSEPSIASEAYATLPGSPPDAPMIKTPFVMKISDKEILSYSAVATLPIYTSGRISASIKAAESQALASLDDKKQAILDIKYAVAEAFIHVLQSTEGKHIANSHLEALTSYRVDVSNLHTQGLVSRNDLLMADVALANAKQAAITVKNQGAIASAFYNQLLNRPLDTAFTLDHLTPEKQGELNIRALTDKALEKRPELSAFRNKIHALNYDAKSIKAAALPQLALTASYSNFDNRLLVDDHITTYGVNMVWPIFDGGVTRHRASQRQHQAAAVQAQFDSFNDRVALEVTQAWLNLNEAHERIKALSQVVEQAEENFKMTKNRYKEGLTNSTEVLEAAGLRRQSLGNHTNATYDASLAWIRLQRMTGEL